MSDSFNDGFKLPPEQQAIWGMCFHPSETFVEFSIEDVESSIPARFEKTAADNLDRVSFRMGADHCGELFGK
jgi:hypothetical protein